MAMVCEPTMKVVSLMDVQPDGAGWKGARLHELYASSDEWNSPCTPKSAPTVPCGWPISKTSSSSTIPRRACAAAAYDAKTGVGGAHENPLREHARGRIYRVVWEKAQRPAIASLKGASTGDLVKALSNDNQLWRLTAQRLLVEGKKSDVMHALKQIVAAKEPGVGAIHALWTLHGLSKLDDETHKTALLSKSSELRRNATRALGSDDKAKAIYFSAGVVSDPDLITRKAAMVKLADFPTTKEIQTVVASLAKKPEHRSDEWLNEATRLLMKKHKAEAYKEGPNLLPNPGFETAGADGLPEGWKRRDYGGRPANTAAEWSVVSGPQQFKSGAKAVRCITRGDADTSLYADVELKTNTMYRLSGWVKGRGGLRGKISFNDHVGRAETEQVRRDGDWTYVEVDYNSGRLTRSSINVLHVARGEGCFDDVKLCELFPMEDATTQNIVGDVKRGDHIFHKHVAACVLCHQLKGQGSTVGPALDGIASRVTPEYIRESLLEPSKVLAKGYEASGVSPMPPMGDIFNAQELADIQAYLQTLK
jgi:mono/diheme cytochrome c family protein